MDEAVPTLREKTSGGAQVIVGVVAVIALLDAFLDDPIAAGSEEARREAGVAVVVIAIVTLLIIFDLTVSAVR